MTTYTQSAAEQTAEENFILRVRVAQFQDEEDNNRTLRETNNGATVDTTVVDDLKEKSRVLREKVRDQENQLSELKRINVTELYHDYGRLDTRRAHLRNENVGLRNILANQRREVKKATRAVNAQQEVRRQNEEQNTFMRSDAQMFRDKREKLMRETNKLSREENRLQEELGSMPARSEDVEAGIEKLEEDNTRKDRQIKQLEADIHAEKEAYGQNAEKEMEEEESAQDDVNHLREEYVRLKEQLKRVKK